MEVRPGEVLAFDFGCRDSPVAEGHIGVDPETTYDAEAGYGLSGTVDCRDREEVEDDMLRDFTIGWDYEFRADLPDGDYYLTVVSGDEIAANNTAVTVNGEDQGSLDPRDPGQYAEHGVEVTVDGGTLTVAMRDDGRINGLLVTQMTPPTGLEVAEVTVDPAQVALSWDAMEGAQEYTVHRSPAGQGSWSELAEVTEPAYTDEAVEVGFSYDYAVTQTSAAGAVSGMSGPVEVAVADPEVEAPESPRDLGLDEADETGVTISWTEVEGAEEYHVHRALSPEGEWERVGTSSSTDWFTEGVAEHSWYYAVSAVNNGGISDHSEPLDTPRTAGPIEDGQVHPQCGHGEYDAEVERDGEVWRAANGGETVFEGYSMHEAMQAAVDSLNEGRAGQESVVVRGSGTMPADISVELDSHTSFEVCGTIHVAGNETPFSYEQHVGAVAIRHAENVTVPYLNVTGTPNFAVYLRTSSDVHFGQMDLRLDGGHGMRMDSRDDDSVREARDISIDDVYVSGTETHGVETYGVDGFTVGTVTVVETGDSGVLLNDTVNADIESVVGQNVAAGTGYATFRTANRNGMIEGEYPTNIRVGEVIADGGGRGIFCVSESGGLEIDRVEISGTESNAMLLENCHNVTVASESGEVEGPGDIVISARDEFDNNSDLTLSNLTLRDTAVREAVCGENTVLRDLTLENTELDTCAELEESEDSPSSPPEESGQPDGEDDGDAPEEGWEPEAEELTAETEGRITVDPTQARPGEEVRVSLGEEHGGLDVQSWLFSDSVATGEATTDDDGEFILTVPEVEPGEHRLAVYTAGGQLLGWTELLVLDQEGQLPAGAAEDDAAIEGVAGADEGREGLASTGLQARSLVLAAAALLILAGGLFALRLSARRG